MRTSMLKKTILCFLCFVFLLLTLTACGEVEVTWLDADGTVLFTQEIEKDAAIPDKDLPKDTNQWHYTEWRQIISGKKEVTLLAERVEKIHVVWLDSNDVVLYEDYIVDVVPEKPLPTDTDQWHYTGWKQTSFGKNITYVADRIANQKVIWLDADGKQLASERVPVGENIPERALPKDTDKWDYTGWSETKNGNEYTYVAERMPQEDYFVGNVFQIIIKDLAGEPLATGTGFVFNKSGWFITNAHVMEDAYQAVAIFEIKDPKTGESFTTLQIKQGAYVHYDKDIFIGKLDGYSKIASHYKNIPFQTKHSVGDVTYSVGYPNSSVSMEIHKGEIKSDLSSLYDKLYSGISYIASDSYIAPGSSGGILVNGNAEVIGMTTLGWFDDNDNFKLGAAIEAYNYTTLTTSKAKESNLQDLAFFLHPNEKTFIKFFRDFITRSNTEKVVDDDLVYYEYVWEGEETNSSGYTYTYEEYLAVFADGFISYGSDYYWDNGDHRKIEYYGFYSSKSEFDTFDYSFKYTFKNGKWYSLECENVTYSENLNLTLLGYTKSSSISHC